MPHCRKQLRKRRLRLLKRRLLLLPRLRLLQLLRPPLLLRSSSNSARPAVIRHPALNSAPTAAILWSAADTFTKLQSCSAFRSTLDIICRALGRAYPSALHSALQFTPSAERLVEHTPLLCNLLYNHHLAQSTWQSTCHSLSLTPSHPHTPPASPGYTDSGGSYRAWPSP